MKLTHVLFAFGVLSGVSYLAWHLGRFTVSHHLRAQEYSDLHTEEWQIRQSYWTEGRDGTIGLNAKGRYLQEGESVTLETLDPDSGQWKLTGKAVGQETYRLKLHTVRQIQ